MTHDELLFKIYEIHNSSSDAGQEATKQYKGMIQFMQALRAVVKLHKPDKEGLCAMNCVVVDDDGYAWTQQQYPCDTIQAIEKELNL